MGERVLLVSSLFFIAIKVIYGKTKFCNQWNIRLSLGTRYININENFEINYYKFPIRRIYRDNRNVFTVLKHFIWKYFEIVNFLIIFFTLRNVMKKYPIFFFFVNHQIRTIYVHRSSGIEIFIYLFIFVYFFLSWPLKEGRRFPDSFIKRRDLSQVYDYVEEKVIIAIALASLHLKKDHVIGRDTPRWTIYFLE